MDSVITTLDPGMENYLRKYRELINLKFVNRIGIAGESKSLYESIES